jgi:hypothetical protein
MNAEEFKSLDMLSEKAIIDTLTPSELNEFKRLLNLWNDNLLQRLYTDNDMD